MATIRYFGSFKGNLRLNSVNLYYNIYNDRLVTDHCRLNWLMPSTSQFSLVTLVLLSQTIIYLFSTLFQLKIKL